jgi:hypothetical protein
MCANIGNADQFDTLAIIREKALTGLANPPTQRAAQKRPTCLVVRLSDNIYISDPPNTRHLGRFELVFAMKAPSCLARLAV